MNALIFDKCGDEAERMAEEEKSLVPAIAVLWHTHGCVKARNLLIQEQAKRMLGAIAKAEQWIYYLKDEEGYDPNKWTYERLTNAMPWRKKGFVEWIAFRMVGLTSAASGIPMGIEERLLVEGIIGKVIQV